MTTKAKLLARADRLVNEAKELDIAVRRMKESGDLSDVRRVLAGPQENMRERKAIEQELALLERRSP